MCEQGIARINSLSNQQLVEEAYKGVKKQSHGKVMFLYNGIIGWFGSEGTFAGCCVRVT